jgi:MoxR-like ATPase
MQRIQAALSATLIERDNEIRAAILALVSQEHLLLIGEPGTAKSLLAISIGRAIAEARAFSILLTKFTAPEEIYGPISLAALKDDRFERKLDGYAALAHILFTDEIFKASSAILNTMLTHLQERMIDNGGARIATPLRLCIAASNEMPSSEDGQELGAIWDRFTIRRIVRPVSPAGRERLLYADLKPVEPCLALADVDAAAAQAARTPIGAPARAALAQILDELHAAGVRPGDRRARKAVKVARAAAVIDGATEVAPVHLEDLSSVLWVDPDQADKTTEIVTRIANPTGAKVNELLRAADECVQSAAGGEPAARMAAIKKLEEMTKEAEKLCTTGNGRAKAAHAHINRERIRLHSQALGIAPDTIEKMLAGV